MSNCSLFLTTFFSLEQTYFSKQAHRFMKSLLNGLTNTQITFVVANYITLIRLALLVSPELFSQIYKNVRNKWLYFLNNNYISCFARENTRDQDEINLIRSHSKEIYLQGKKKTKNKQKKTQKREREKETYREREKKKKKLGL